MKNSFSLVELVIACFIVIVLTSMGLAQYYKARSKVFAKDAAGELQMILQAEAVYRLENAGVLIACKPASPCTSALGVPTLNTQQGRVYCANVADPNNICVSAHMPDSANYSMNSSVGVLYAGDCASCW